VRLPNVEIALVEQTKITQYLLSDENSGGKSSFFAHFGFKIEDWHILQNALIHHATQNLVKRIMETPHGIKYIIEGEIRSPDNRNPHIRSIWIIDNGKSAPRLVTAYPITGDTT
jgi:hypothetical protein